MGLINPDLTGNLYGDDLKPVVEAILREFNGNISNENISDDIKLGYGQIANWYITNNYLYPDPNGTASIQTASSGTVGDGSANSAGVLFNKDGIYACEANQLLGNGNVRILTDGSAYFSGTVTAGAGSIGGWTIGATSLTAGTGTSTVGLDTGGTNPVIYAGSDTPTSAPFQVTKNGVLTATAGTIGGFIITGDSLYGSTIKTGATVAVGSNGVIMDSAGLRGYDSVLGNTFNLPTNGSAPTFSSGVISSTTFEINTSSILRTSSTVGDGSASSAGILINNTGIYACAANQLLSNANIKILNDGTATISASVKGGQTDFNTGTGYFLGSSGGAYKFSIGDPTGNYLTWDSNYLRIKGSIELSTVLPMVNYATANLPSPIAAVGYNNPGGTE
jgi:hypothetical protein